MNTPYTILKYDPNWINLFNELKEKLSRIFAGKFTRIEHVGSTSIPGMNAKPLIDALIVVDSMDNLVEQRKMMVEEGYEYRENYVAPNTILFYKTEKGEKVENIHVCTSVNDLFSQLIFMRDYLREHPEKAKEYSDLKLQLKEKYPDSYEAYKDGKRSLLDEIKRLAYGWNEGR